MIFIPVRGHISPTNGLKIPLEKSFKGYEIGLASFDLPNITKNPFLENSIELTCDQIDSSLANPKRILKRLCFNRPIRNDYFNSWQANLIEFYPLDSDDTFITIKLGRLITSSTLGSDITYHRYSGYFDHESFFTLVLRPINDQKSRWACI